MEFIRYGSLKPQLHDLSNKKWFHTPPVEMGIYAFPEGYTEGFLLTGVGKGSVNNGRYRYAKDPKGNKIQCIIKNPSEDKYIPAPEIGNFLDEWVELYNNVIKNYYPKLKQDDFAVDVQGNIMIQTKPLKFTHKGNIWSHLADFVKPCDMLARTPYWVLTDMKTYQKALVKAVAYQKNMVLKSWKMKGRASGIPVNMLYKDVLEVYIEHVE